MSYNVLIVEDQKMHRQLLEIFINSNDRYNLAGSISNSDLALSFCEKMHIDLILMDVMTEFGSNGLEASRTVKSSFPDTKIIIITSMPETTWIARAREIGVDSFWYKEAEGETIQEIIDRTMAGEHIFPDSSPNIHIGRAKSHDFTDRELEVLREILSGDSNKEIADRMNISVETVKSHIKSMLNKTGFHTRTELAIEARSLGIVIR